MSPAAARRKRPQEYDASGRHQRAREHHATTLARAQGLFLEHGYSTTTVAAIAQAAGVSAATVYKTYGGKAGLVRELCTRALAGAGPVPAEERSDALRANADPRIVIAGWCVLVAEVSPRISPLLLLLRAAAEADPEAAALYDELDRARLARMTDNARYLADGGHLRDGITLADARDVLWFCSSPELYELLVVSRGWPPARLGTFAAQTMVATLL